MNQIENNNFNNANKVEKNSSAFWEFVENVKFVFLTIFNGFKELRHIEYPKLTLIFYYSVVTIFISTIMFFILYFFQYVSYKLVDFILNILNKFF